MLAVVLALCASLSIGTGDFLAGSQARRTSLWAVIVVSQITGFIWTGVLVAARGHGLPLEELWAAVGAGITAVAGIALGYKALSIGIMGIVGPIISLSVAVPLAVGLARGERPSAYQLGGIVIALAGVILAARQKSAGTRHHATSRLSIVLALSAAATVGVNMLCYASAAKHDPYWGIFIARATSALIFALAFALMRPKTHLTKAAIIPLMAVGVLDTGSNGLYFDSAAIPICTASGSTVFYCPSSRITLSATLVGANAVSIPISFSIDNALALFGNPSQAVLPTLSGPVGDAHSFDWGLPFFYGRRVFIGIEGQASSLGTGPYFAF